MEDWDKSGNYTGKYLDWENQLTHYLCVVVAIFQSQRH